MFRHALVQEAAYESLLRNNRRTLHLTIGEVLEKLYPDRLDEFAPVLGNHFDEGEDYQRALAYYARAGDLATQRYANAEAEMHYGRALAIAKSHEAGAAGAHTLRDLYLKLGRAQELTGRYDDALAHYREMQSDARLRGDRALELAAMIAQSIIHSAPTLRFDPPKAQALSTEALAIARDLGDQSSEARLLWHASLVQKFLGHWAEHVRLGKHAAQIARRLGDRDLLAYVLNDIGEGLVTVEQIEHGIAALDEAHELWLASNNTPMLIDNRCNLSYAYFVSGQFQPAKILAHEAHALSERTHNLWGIVYSAVLFGYICRETGESAAALDALHEAFHLGQQSGFGLALWFTPTMLALISLDLGDAAQAIDYARAGEYSVSTGFLYAKGFITAAYLLASITLADFKRAEAVRPEAEAFLFADEM
ncbi:MAG: hypothetical protein E6J26_08700, partial [Chloroflexi bacterium]